ncbi:carbonic anhydrase [Stackebrandtia nassauensis DSM 44728]|uniref:Carbonic anhydrase n=2 Tax=Stackebrandtia TaxID=283810 RepID=D3Q3J0_STANL|nr:carbonic anhydrase [Stackebrandtia nassauensis DSM 44728]
MVMLFVAGMLVLADLPPPLPGSTETTDTQLLTGATTMLIPPHLPARARAALRALLDGNRRFISGSPTYSRDISSARAAAGGQRPIAAVFTCVDSRVTAESLFDCDFGQLIVVRTAGHVPDRAAVGSLRFAVDALAVPLVIVLGHERCGAVKLAVDTLRDPNRPEQLDYLVEQLSDPVAKALSDGAADPCATAMRLQIDQTVAVLKGDPGVAAASIVGARYDLDNGTVSVHSA